MKAIHPLTCMVALGVCLSLTAHSAAMAAQPPGPAAVPVEHASFHQLVFADEDLAILNNLYPPKGDSGFHTHYRDLFAVVIQASPSSSQSPGKPLSAVRMTPVGAVAYSAVGPEPRTHRVVNDSAASSMQFIVIELRRPDPAGTASSARDGAPQYVQVLDHPRMRAWRLVLQPGQSVPAIQQTDKGVRVVVRGGLLTTMTPGLLDQRLAVRSGDVAVQAAGATRALRNDGTDTIELVELELK